VIHEECRDSSLLHWMLCIGSPLREGGASDATEGEILRGALRAMVFKMHWWLVGCVMLSCAEFKRAAEDRGMSRRLSPVHYLMG